MSAAERPTIIGTGLIALDLLVRPSSDQPSQAWTGGTCGNVLAALSYLGWDALPIARLNGDPASCFVREDLRRWGVRLDHASLAPTCATPIIVQLLRRDRRGEPSHRFSWNCPHCGSWLPSFKPVPAKAVETLLPKLEAPRVFFMDRLSRGALKLAAWASEAGALVVFEPSGKPDAKLLGEALQLAHIVKYAEDRIAELDAFSFPESAVLVEIQTAGASGLRYRSRLPRAGTTGWRHLPALPAPRVVDTCGAGDWATAGLIAKCGAGGRAGFEALKPAALRHALIYGQALSAWNCGFEGARGGMYVQQASEMEGQIRQILLGERDEEWRGAATVDQLQLAAVPCPACPSDEIRVVTRHS